MSVTTITAAAAAPVAFVKGDDATADALAALLRAEERGAIKYGEYVVVHSVTRETVKDHAAALAALAWPKDDAVQTVDGERTRYGNAVQRAATGLRRALGKSEEEGDTGTVNILTGAGVKSLAEMDDAGILAAVRAELAARVTSTDSE